MREAEEIEALAARCAALETIWNEGAEDGSESVQSVRRIVRSMEPSLEVYGDPDLARLAREARAANPDELAELIPALVAGTRVAIGKLPRERMRILLVEADSESAGRFEEILAEPSRSVRVVRSVGSAERLLVPDPPDLVVVRLELEESDGRDLLLSLLNRPLTSAIPTIVLTTRPDPVIRAECVALGADELIEIPFEPEILQAAVSSLLRRRAALTRLAQEDHLTGLPNRAAFARLYERLQSLAERNGEPLTLAVLDVDLLKEVNDRLGHPAGDRLLEELADVVKDGLRSSDVLARWGGDEFVALFPDTDPEGAESALQKTQRLFQESARLLREFGTLDLDVTFSAGITAVRAGESVEEAVARADHFLYQAKRLGRDRLVMEEVDELEAPDVLLVEDEGAVADVFRRFLERGGFRVRWVDDGDAALAAVRDPRPDLVVLDIMLPGKDGFTVLRELRNDPELQDLPVLILTALGEEEAVVEGFRLGVDEYLVKPVSGEEFLAKVRRLVRPD